MRALLLAALAVQAGAAAAQAGPTIYGSVDAGVELLKAGSTEKRVYSNGLSGNRLGFKGSEDLGGGLSAVFQLEMGFNADDGTLGQGGRLFGRQATVGLSSATLGTVLLGRAPTPYYSNQNAVDAFTWGMSGGIPSMTRSAASSGQVVPMIANARADNAVTYISPKLGGLEARLQGAPSEASAVLGRARGASLRYRQGRVDLVLAYTEQDAASAGTGRVQAAVAGGSYNFGAVKLFAGYTNEKNSCSTCTGALARLNEGGLRIDSDFRLLNLGLRAPFGRLTAIAQAIRLRDRSHYLLPTGSRDATWLALGQEYALSKRFIVYGSIATIGNRNGSRYAAGTGNAQQPAGRVGDGDPRASTLSLGMRYTF